jgi:hypothetical protein
MVSPHPFGCVNHLPRLQIVRFPKATDFSRKSPKEFTTGKQQ